MPIITYDNLKQQADQNDPTTLPNSDGLAASGSITNPPTATIPTQITNIPNDDFNTESGLVGKSGELNTKLSFTDVDNGKVNAYAGGQVLINSNRIILNSKLDFLMLFGQAGVAISSQGDVCVDAEEGVTLYGEDGVYIGVPGKGTGTEEGGGVTTGEDPDIDYEPLVLGEKLTGILEDLITTIQNMKVITTVGEAYLSSQIGTELAKIKARLPQIKSTYAFIDGISHEPPDPMPFSAEDGEQLTTGVTGDTIGAGVGSDVSTQPQNTTTVGLDPDVDFETNDPYA